LANIPTIPNFFQELLNGKIFLVPFINLLVWLYTAKLFCFSTRCRKTRSKSLVFSYIRVKKNFSVESIFFFFARHYSFSRILFDYIKRGIFEKKNLRLPNYFFSTTYTKHLSYNNFWWLKKHIHGFAIFQPNNVHNCSLIFKILLKTV